jgi:hypothetical protein
MTARLFTISASVARTVDATRVEYRSLGNSGLRVSYPILGGMSFGNSRWMDWVLDEDQALPVLKAAYDIGINTVSLNMQSIRRTPKSDRKERSLTAAIVGHGQCVLKR